LPSNSPTYITPHACNTRSLAQRLRHRTLDKEIGVWGCPTGRKKPVNMSSNRLILEHVLNDPELLYQVLQAAQVATRVCGRTSSVVQRMEKLMQEKQIKTYSMPAFNIGRPSAKTDAHTWHDGPIVVTQEMVDCVWLGGKSYIHATLGRYKGWTLDGNPNGEGELVLARLCAPNTIETTSCRSHWVL